MRGVDGLDGASFDVVVIGGGILGAGVALELVERGYTCLLVERADFAQGTTARSTRLIHGGLRYLAMFDFGLVREGLRERAFLLADMPNLVRPLAILLPHYGQPPWERARIWAGLTLYDLLSPRGALPGHAHLSRAAVVGLEKGLRAEGLQSADRYWDGQAELPERLVVEVLQRASERGAEVRNYVEAVGIPRTNGRVEAVDLVDLSTGRKATASAGAVINATGPWADAALAAMGVDTRPLLRLSQGVHLVYPQLAEHALAVRHPRDGRLCFVIPWLGATMVGTTDTDVHGPPEAARIRPEDVNYLSEIVDRYFPGSPAPIWGSVGVRSLSRGGGGRRRLPQSVSRRHALIDHSTDGAAGLYTLAGGKLTAWRATGRFVVDRIGSVLPTATGRSQAPGPPSLLAETPRAEGLVSASPQPRDRLWWLYGDRARDVRDRIDEDPWWGEPIVAGGDAIRAEIVHAIEQEWALTLADIVLRRLALGFGADLGAAAAASVATVCRERLGWTDERVELERLHFDEQNRERRLPEAASAERAAA